MVELRAAERSESLAGGPPARDVVVESTLKEADVKALNGSWGCDDPVVSGFEPEGLESRYRHMRVRRVNL